MSQYQLLGRRAKPDERDFPLREAMPALMRMGLATSLARAPRARTHRSGSVLDQSLTPPSFDDDHPYCVGFAGTGVVMGDPVRVKLADPTAFALAAYAGAQANDEWPDDQPYDGTSARGLCAWLKQQGMINEYHWCQTAEEVGETVLRYRPVLLGVPWSDNMFEPDSKGVVTFDPSSIVGGHEIFARGYDSRSRLLRCRNSWGLWWGKRGDFFMHVDTLQALMEAGGDAVVPTEVRVLRPKTK